MDPTNTTAKIIEQALEHAVAGRAREAEELARQALAADPDHPDAYYVLGIVAASRADHAEAIKLFDRAITRERGAFWYHVARGESLAITGDLAGATDAFAQALLLKPDCLEACRARSALLARTGRVDEAIDEYRRWIKLDPKNISIRVQLAHMLLARKRIPEAGETASDTVSIAPTDASAHLVLARVFDAIYSLDKATAHYQRAADLDPRDPQARHFLAYNAARDGDMDRAMQLWRQAIALKPDWIVPHNFLVQNLNYDPKLSRQEIFDEHLVWAKQFAEPLTAASAAHRFENSRDPDRPLRIGYVSCDFTNHPIAAFIRPILQAHDRAKFHAICFSDVAAANPYTDDLKSLAGGWVPIVGKSDEQVVELVRQQQIDVLVDLTGQLAGNRLLVFARRAAPVQITYLGYCNTTGLSAMDWTFLDDITDPPDDTQPYTEKILRLPHGFSCYAPKTIAADPNDLPALANGYVTLASFHRPKKLNAIDFDTFARLLNEIPRAKILFWRNLLFGRAAERIKSEMKQRGITEGRFEIRFKQPPTRTHLGMYHAVDISLDTQPWSGHTTSCESMWMGVPFVTMRGNNHAGRMAASAMTHAGAGEFVGKDREEYIAIIKQLAGDLPRLSDLRKSLRNRMQTSDLCNAKQFTVEFETALRTAWRGWCGS